MGRVQWSVFIKTEEDFISEFGEDWRNTIEYKWVSPEMDYLFGLGISKADHSKILKKITGIDSFNISRDMIKVINYGD